MAYQNLAGVFPKFNDGNLRFGSTGDGPVTVVIGTASSGFTSTPFIVNDFSEAAKEFGRTSELVRKMLEVRDGQATGGLPNNIMLWRLPGNAPSLSGIGADLSGSSSALFTITPVLASTEAATKYGVAYQHTETRGAISGTANTTVIVGKLMIVDLDSNEVVWQGTRDGVVEVDLGLMDVVFPTSTSSTSTLAAFTLTVATGTEAASHDYTVTIAGVEITVESQISDEEGDVATALAAAIEASSLGSKVAASASGAVVTVTAAGTCGADGILRYPTGHPYAGAPFELVLESVTVSAGGLAISASATVNRGANNVGMYPVNVNQPFGRRVGGHYIPLANVADGGTSKNFSTSLDLNFFGLNNLQFSDEIVELTTGSTGETISLMKRYEKLDEAYSLLDFTQFDVVVPCGVALNDLNLGDDSDLATDMSTYPNLVVAMTSLVSFFLKKTLTEIDSMFGIPMMMAMLT